MTICIPVYNGASTLKRAISSVLQQQVPNLEIVILDNASTDETRELAMLEARNNSCISVHANTFNIGGYENFKRILQYVSGDYVYFLAADDFLSPGSLLALLETIADNEDVAAASPSVVFIDDNNIAISASTGTDSITGNRCRRLTGFLKGLPNDNSRFYSLYRRKHIIDSFMTTQACHGADWIIVAKMLLQGDFRKVDKATLYRGQTNTESYAKAVKADNRMWLTFGYPMLPFSFQVLIQTPLHCLPRIISELVRINKFKRAQYMTLGNDV